MNIESIDDIDFNRELHDGVLHIIGAISIEGVPVGGILAKIIGLFWAGPDDTEAQWNGVKRFAEELVREEIDKERIEVLNNRLEGLAEIAKEYKNTSFGSPQKGQHLTTLLNLLRAFHADFWDDRNPEKMFPLFTTFGTLWVSALYEQAYLYEKVYEKQDTDADYHLSELRKNVLKYAAGAQAIYDRLYLWRYRKLEITEVQTYRSVALGRAYESKWTFTDKYDGFTKSATAAALNDSHYHAPISRDQMEREQRDRIFEKIENSYVNDLQGTLTVAQLWRYLEPEGIRPLTHFVIDGEGPWGGDKDRAHDFEDRPVPGARITRIAMRTEAFIEGLQLSYDGQETGWHGNDQRGQLNELVLDPDEEVVEVFGRATSLIDNLGFRTSKGRVIEGGTSPGNQFSAKGRPEWLRTSLQSISGWTDGKRMTGLKLHWKHQAAIPTYTPSYRTTAPLPMGTNLHLKSENGKFISAFSKEYTSSAASKEYYPKLGDTPAALQLVSPTNAAVVSDKGHVRIETTESGVGHYRALGKFEPSATYYYLPTYGDQQLWSVIKVIPSDGPVQIGDRIYLRNVDRINYLSIDKKGYITSVNEPHAWEVVVP